MIRSRYTKRIKDLILIRLFKTYPVILYFISSALYFGGSGSTVSVSLHPPQCPYTSIPVVRFMPVMMRNIQTRNVFCFRTLRILVCQWRIQEFQNRGVRFRRGRFLRSGVCFNAPSHIPYVFVARVVNKIYCIQIQSISIYVLYSQHLL